MDNQNPQQPQQPFFFDPNQPVKSGSPYYDLMLNLSDLGAKERGIKDQMMLADELRGADMPGMRSNSRINVAANPLEFVNTGMQRTLGTAQRKQGSMQQEALANEIRRRIQEERDRRMGSGTSSPPTNPGMVYSDTQET